ncbi:MAG: hypothetical protein IJK67_02500 [Bacilli bacterium]|nr:hypothetical protein [Bacilli bacterium]
MSNILYGIKRFLKNKNTVTIIAIVLSLVIIYFAYNARIKKATEPQLVPYALQDLAPRTLITTEMVGTRKVPGSVITPNVITNKNSIIGMYVSNKVQIPKDSLFYRNTLLTWDELPSSLYENIPEGNTIVALPVSIETTYGNSIFEGNYIDLYYSGRDTDGKILVGKFIESIKVLAVTDTAFNNIFEKTSDMGQPAYLVFSVPEEMHLLLRKALYLNGGSIYPVPRNAEYSKNPKNTRISSSYIENLILNQTVNVTSKDLSGVSIREIENGNTQGGEQ